MYATSAEVFDPSPRTWSSVDPMSEGRWNHAATRMTEDLLGPMAEKVLPDCVTPLTVFLSSEACDVTHSIYSVGGGRYARIFVAMGQGWVKGPGQAASVEEVAANWDAIHSDANYTIPDSIAGETTALLEALKG